MWWILIPGAAAAAYKVYDLLKEDDSEGGPEPTRDPLTGGAPAPAAPASGGPSDLPRFGPRFARWVAILRKEEAAAKADPVRRPETAGDEEPTAVAASSRRWLRPSHLTLLTAVLVVGFTIAGRASDAAWIRWTQMVLLGALIGIGTNWVAIKMLFRPRKKILGFIQGVVPANQARIAEQIAHGVASQLLDKATIHRAVHESDLVGSGLDEMVEGLRRLIAHDTFQKDVKELLVAYVGAFAEDPSFRQRLLDAIGRIARQAPSRLGGVLGVFSKEIGAWLESMVHEHHEEIMVGLQSQVPGLVDEASDRLQVWLERLPARIEERRGAIEEVVTESIARRASSFDVEGMVRGRLEAFSTGDLERLILDATDEQLVWLQLLGWIIGAAAVPLLAGLEAFVRLF